MTITVEVRERREPQVPENRLFSFAPAAGSSAPAESAERNYSEIELAVGTRTSDFDIATVAVLGSIIGFKFLMLGLLLVSL